MLTKIRYVGLIWLIVFSLAVFIPQVVPAFEVTGCTYITEYAGTHAVEFSGKCWFSPCPVIPGGVLFIDGVYQDNWVQVEDVVTGYDSIGFVDPTGESIDVTLYNADTAVLTIDHCVDERP